MWNNSQTRGQLTGESRPPLSAFKKNPAQFAGVIAADLRLKCPAEGVPLASSTAAF